jgi:hypothetical protein
VKSSAPTLIDRQNPILPRGFGFEAQAPILWRARSKAKQAVVFPEGHVSRNIRAAIGLFAVGWFGAGCGSNTAPPAIEGKPAVAGGNSRIPFKEEYKKMIGNDGKMLFKPSESKKRPKGVP